MVDMLYIDGEKRTISFPGHALASPRRSYPDELFDQVMAVNVKGVWLGLKRVMPLMERRGGGSIVIHSK